MMGLFIDVKGVFMDLSYSLYIAKSMNGVFGVYFR